MAYISNKLCHFVGRSLASDLDRFRLLQKIILSGMLLVNPNKENSPSEIKTTSQYTKIDDLGEVFPEIACVCFCDIPDDELLIHTTKYSKFGLAFKKDFLVHAGARPVQYVPKDFDMSIQMNGCITPKDSNKYFIDINRLLVYTLTMIDVLNGSNNSILRMYQEKKASDKLLQQASIHFEMNLPEIVVNNNIHGVTYALSRHIMNSNAYIKLFDPMLPNDDPQNYYMEREWRCLENVTFTIDDIVAVYLPHSEIIEDQFVKRFPELENRIYILE